MDFSFSNNAALYASPPRTPSYSRRSTTPKRTPEADRFIPDRRTRDLDVAHFHLTSKENSSAIDDGNTPTSVRHFQQAVKSTLLPTDTKVLTFSQRAPSPLLRKVLYTQPHVRKQKRGLRFIPQAPDRVLDAPDLRPDFYLNLIDWSSTNVIAVALGATVYLWDATSGSVTEFCKEQRETGYVSSVSWIGDGSHVALGTNSGIVQIWDVERQKKVRSLVGQQSRVASMAWNNHILSSGARTGAIMNSDVRVQSHLIKFLHGHTQDVCGLKWSGDGKHLASGGNDNIVNIWDVNGSNVHTLHQHQAAVKALAWCPWQHNLLVSGGGTADQTLKFWNTTSGALINSVNTKSQVSSVLWNKEHRELISGHGYSENQLIIWKYPNLSRVTELQGHTHRVLSMVMSPDGTTVASAAEDETLRFWKCFAKEKSSRRGDGRTKLPSPLYANIR